MKKIAIVIVAILSIIAVANLLEDRRAEMRAAYAEQFGCTWHYQGTAYGDDRDYICRKD